MKLQAGLEEIRKVADEMCASLALKHSMIHLCPDMLSVFVVEPHLPILFASAAWEKILGYPTEDIEGTHFEHLIHPDDIAELRAKVEQIVQTGKAMGTFRNKVRRRDGVYVTVEWRSSGAVEGRCYMVGRELIQE